jgi:hypothetical protein
MGGAVGIVSAGVMRGSLSAGVSYDAPSVSSAGASNAASSGGTIVSVVGRGGAGSSGASSKARVGWTACAGSVWLSDSGLVCRSASGRLTDGRVGVSSERQYGSVSLAVSYDAPVVSSVGASNAASSGGMSVTVVGGGGLGMSDSSVRGRAGASGCAASVWRSDSGVLCRSCSGLRSGAAVAASSGVQRGSLSAVVSYDAPSVSSAGASNAASSGAASVTVVGSCGFGGSGFSAAGRVGGSAGDASLWRSDSVVVCRAGAGHGGGGRTLEVSAGLQRGSLSAGVSYDAPSVSSAGASNAASSGAASVTVVGQGGMGEMGSSAGARVGRTACQASVWASSSGVVCKAAGGLLGGAVGIVSAGVLRGSASALVSYDAPSLSSAGVSNVASSGGTSVTVVGRGGAGWSGASSKARVGWTACGASVWLSDSALVSRSASGGMAGERVAVSSGRQYGSVSLAVSTTRLL